MITIEQNESSELETFKHKVWEVEILDDIRRLVAALRAVITYCEPIASNDRTIEPYHAGERGRARAVLGLVTEALMVEM